MAAGELKVYFDLLSQPSRAVVLFLKMNKIPHVACPVALRKGAHLTQDYAEKVSPFQKVPVIHDGEFKLTESVAILRHLCRTRGDLVAEHWYPKDPLIRARVDEYLEWQHANTRFNCAMYFMKKWVIPTMTGEAPRPGAVEGIRQKMEKTLDELEGIWLKNRPFVATQDKISVADLLAVCELEQPSMAGYDVYEGRMVLSEWGKRVKSELAPFYDEANAVVYMIRDKFKGEPASKL